MVHAREHVERLADILGGPAPEARLRASELAGCADCRRELEECLALERELGRLAGEERSEIAAAGEVELADEPGRAEREFAARFRVAGTGAAETRVAPRPPRSLPWALLGAAAAALLLVFSPEPPSPEPRSPGPPSPGAEPPAKLGDVLAPTHPVGAVESYAPFEWDAEPSAAGWFRVEVLGTTPGWSGAPIRSARLREARWEPTAEELARMPASIRWRVELHRDSSARDVLATGAARARLEQP